MTGAQRCKGVGFIVLSLSTLSFPGAAMAKWRPGYVPQERTWFSYGGRFTQPQGATASLTVMRAMETDTMMVSGWFAQAEPGLGGGKLSLGLGGMGLSERRGLPPVYAAGVKASVVRTWGSPIGADKDRTLVGPEADLTICYVKLSAGYLWPVDGGDKAGLFTWGVGLGF